KYDGTNWVYVGQRGMSGAYANYVSLAVDSSGTPYVGYPDNFTPRANGKMTVKKFADTAWITAGKAGFSPVGVTEPYLAFDRNNNLYASFASSSMGGYVYLMKLDDTSWSDVGTHGDISRM